MSENEQLLQRSRRWSTRLLEGPVSFFPIRHHSPACARHLSLWLQKHRPQVVIVEGPRSFDRLIPSLVDPLCKPPVAILSTYRDSNDVEATRHSAFYPMCDYSPEWIAMREGTALGAKVRFADMEFANKVQIEHNDETDQDTEGMLGVLLADESRLRHSQYIQGLTRRMGCRDFDELWDHLFESQSLAEDTAGFVGRLAAYCDLSRRDYETSQLKRDGTQAREAIMLAVLQEEYARIGRPSQQASIVVVTGGFHTVALADSWQDPDDQKDLAPSSLDAVPNELVGNWLIRYSYDQLDSLSGYQSGMPHPGFYDAMYSAWSDVASTEGREQGSHYVASRLISEIARATRGASLPYEASVTDTIAAVAMLKQLANLRGHQIPTRSDLLDAVYGCMRKDSVRAADGLAAIVQSALTGNKIGEVPPSAGQPPIVEDFRFQTSKFRLPVAVLEARQMSLELYRKPPHRQISFLFHQLGYLDIPYATFVDGPNFAYGYHLSKLIEQWHVNWSPGTEARLVQSAALGDTVSGAAACKLQRDLDELARSDTARSANLAVDKLILMCRMGLHQFGARISGLIEHHVVEDAEFASVSAATSKLHLLLSAREPLEASRLTQLPDLVQLCYQRACQLIDSLENIPDELVESSLEGLCSLRELLAAEMVSETETSQHSQDEDSSNAESDTSYPTLDPAMFEAALSRMIEPKQPFPRSECAGAAAGLLHGMGCIDSDQVCYVVGNYLDSSIADVSAACGAVRGLMMTNREAFWQMDTLLKQIDSLFQSWEEDRFHSALPHLRLAFSQLSPKETDLVAQTVAHINDVESVDGLYHPEVSEAELQLGLALSRMMQQSLTEDGL